MNGRDWAAAGLVAFAAVVALVVIIASRLKPHPVLALLERVWPDEGKHSPHAVMTPAPGQRPAQEPGPADPPTAHIGAVRARATTPLPSPGASPAGRGQSQEPGGAPPWAALSPGAAAAPAPPGPPSGAAGPGQRKPWVTWHRPHGEQVVIGYGPTAEIPRPYAQRRVTGAHVVVPDPPMVSRRYEAHEAHVDKAVNEP